MSEPVKVGDKVYIAVHFPLDGLLRSEEIAMAKAGYVGTVTKIWDGKACPYRVDFGTTYAYFSADELMPERGAVTR